MTQPYEPVEPIPPLEPAPPPFANPGSTETKPKRKIPWFGLVFLAIQILFLVWIIVGVNSATDTSAVDCTGLSAEDCKSLQGAADAGTAIGTGLGVAVIIGLWVAVDLILGITYAVIRFSRRR